MNSREPKFKQLMLKKCRKLIKARGGKCLSEEYVLGSELLTWECSKGHQWQASYRNMADKRRVGNLCPECTSKSKAAKLKKFKNISGLQKIAKQRGGKLLSTEYLNDQQKLLWECSKGHQWQTTYHAIRSGTWCRVCATEEKAKQQQLGISYAYNLARKFGGRCLSDEYISTTSPLKWQCKQGHVWESKLVNVKKAWCSACRKKKIADEQFPQILKLLKEKNYKCLSSSVNTVNDLILIECPKGHKSKIHLSRVRSCLIFCWVCSKTMSPNIDHTKALAWSKGGECLSEKVTNICSDLHWRCAKWHTWKASIKETRGLKKNQYQGKWCPECSLELKSQSLSLSSE